MSQQQSFDPATFVTLKQQSPSSYQSSPAGAPELMVSPDDVVYHRESPGKYQWSTAATPDQASVLVPKMEPEDAISASCATATSTTMLLTTQPTASLAEYNQSTSKVS